MASTVQTPPPAPPMRPVRPPRSFAGPVVLIIIGILGLMGTMGMLEWHRVFLWFAHFWPALLILWGIIKLIEYQQSNRSGVRSGGIGAGGVVLIVFLVVAGLTATSLSRVDWQRMQEEFNLDSDNPWWGHSYNYTDDFQQVFPAGGSLKVTNEHGAININASDDNQIHVSVHKRINAERQDQADRWNNDSKPQLTVAGQQLTLDANTKGAGDHWINTDLDIALPRKATLTISTWHGDISVMGRDANAAVTSQDGDVAITDLNGGLTLSLENSSARISQVSSDVTIQGRAKEVSIEDVKGAVHLDGDFREDLKLARIAKAVSFRTTRTEMDIAKVEGYLNLDSGDLEANSISGPLRLKTRSKDIMLNGVNNDVRLTNENGAVEVHVSKLGPLDITNSRGDIRVYVPAKAGFQLQAQAHDGEIQTDFNSLKIENGDTGGTGNGSANGGGPRMVLNNEHGSIEVRTDTGVAALTPTPPSPKSPRSPDTPQESEN
jgi:DUF4097 and DUF4098 domain-containing protein YvlB